MSQQIFQIPDSGVVIFTTSRCPYCVSAKNLLGAKGISYSEISLDYEDMRAAFKSQFPTFRTVPQIWMNGQHVGGFDDLKKKLSSDHSTP
jgi:glutaredoxin 3